MYVSPGGGNLSTSIFIGGLRMLFLLQVNENQGFLTYYSCRKVVVVGRKIPKEGHLQVKQGKGVCCSKESCITIIIKIHIVPLSITPSFID